MSLAPHFDPAHIYARLDDLLPGRAPVLLGYSGGGDSHALLLIAAEWARARKREFHAVIVDHGLREESAAEAQIARNAATGIGVTAHIANCPAYSGDGSGIQAWARAQRYACLAQCARYTGAQYILLGHTADDLAETVWMRLIAGAGYRGLAAMGEDDSFPIADMSDELRVLRPLLGVRRQALRDWLGAQNAQWIDDPSNEDRRHTRIRTRQALTRLEQGGFKAATLTGLAAQCRALKRVTSQVAARAFLQVATLTQWGGIRLNADCFCALSHPVGGLVLEAAIACVTGAQGPLRRQGVAALRDGLIAHEPATGAGAVLLSHRSEIWLVRDPGAVLGRVGEDPIPDLDLPSNATGLWDGRFSVKTHANYDACVTSLGRIAPDNVPTDLDLSAIPPLARTTLPVAHRGGIFLAIPGIMRHADVKFTQCGPARAQHSLFAGQAPAWFDDALHESGLLGSQ